MMCKQAASAGAAVGERDQGQPRLERADADDHSDISSRWKASCVTLLVTMESHRGDPAQKARTRRKRRIDLVSLRDLLEGESLIERQARNADEHSR